MPYFCNYENVCQAMDRKPITPLQARHKLEQYCAYQERCHWEVRQKMFSLRIDRDLAEEILVHLIDSGFLDEERFARAFARGKHRIKHWGKQRITMELKARQISAYNMKAALSEIQDGYEARFEQTAQHAWAQLERYPEKERKLKLYAFLFRKGYESSLISKFLEKL